MRVSALLGDPGFVEPRSRTRNLRIYLDGIEVSDCITADDEAGIVVTYVVDEAGRPVLQGDRLKMQVHCGVVRIDGELLPCP